MKNFSIKYIHVYIICITSKQILMSYLHLLCLITNIIVFNYILHIVQMFLLNTELLT